MAHTPLTLLATKITLCIDWPKIHLSAPPSSNTSQLPCVAKVEEWHLGVVIMNRHYHAARSHIWLPGDQSKTGRTLCGDSPPSCALLLVAWESYNPPNHPVYSKRHHKQVVFHTYWHESCWKHRFFHKIALNDILKRCFVSNRGILRISVT